MAVGFLIAAIVSGVAFFVHAIQGTSEVKAPLLDSAMAEGPKYTLYLAWHCCTLALGTVTLGFAWAAFVPSAWDVGAIMTLTTGLCTIWGLLLQRQAGVGFLVLPQWSGFLVITLAGLWSLVA